MNPDFDIPQPCIIGFFVVWPILAGQGGQRSWITLYSSKFPFEWRYRTEINENASMGLFAVHFGFQIAIVQTNINI